MQQNLPKIIFDLYETKNELKNKIYSISRNVKLNIIQKDSSNYLLSQNLNNNSINQPPGQSFNNINLINVIKIIYIFEIGERFFVEYFKYEICD